MDETVSFILFILWGMFLMLLLICNKEEYDEAIRRMCRKEEERVVNNEVQEVIVNEPQEVVMNNDLQSQAEVIVEQPRPMTK